MNLGVCLSLLELSEGRGSGDFSAYVRLAMHCPAEPGGKALLFVVATERYHKKKLRKREWRRFLM